MNRPVPVPLRIAVAILLLTLALTGGCTYELHSQVNLRSDLERASIQTPGGGTLSYLRAGDPDAPRVIYVHGTPGQAANFEDFLRNPIDGFESIAVDRLGFGESEPGRAEPSFQKQAEAISALLVRRRGRWPILVGHSLGGPIVARVAADYPERVGGLVIVAGSLDPALECPRWYNHVIGFPLVFALLSPGLRHSNEEIMAAPEQTRLLAERMDRITSPVVILHGNADGLVPVGNAAYTRASLTSAQSVQTIILDGMNHEIPFRDPGVIRRAVQRLAAARRHLALDGGSSPSKPDDASSDSGRGDATPTGNR